MLIIPAIDIIGGQCVRLTKGDYNSKKIYNNDPLKVAKEFEKLGANMLHIVDLDGAKTGNPTNQKLICEIAKQLDIGIQVGGGIRSIEIAKKYLNSGIERVVIGTKAISEPALLQNLIKEFGSRRIVAGMDIKDNKIATNGWIQTSDKDYLEFAELLKSLGVSEVIVTDITRDGTLTTPNFAILDKLKPFGFNMIASGGISDLSSIKKLNRMGVFAAIIGKAIYEEKINLGAALEVINNNSDLAKRIIPCLDVKEGRVVKGINFAGLQDAGDPVELGKKYSEAGADELVFLDITASKEKRGTVYDMVSKVSENVFIPFTVGGGISSIDEIRRLLKCGADKVSLNTSAVLNPPIIKEAAKVFGSQCIVVAMDAKRCGDTYKIFIRGGSEETDLEAVDWAKQVEKLGAGEILLTSMDRDGTKAGFDLEILQKISEAVNIPVIASGGAGSLKDIKDAILLGKADAVLAASIFHYNRISIKKVKSYLKSNNLCVRL